MSEYLKINNILKFDSVQKDLQGQISFTNISVTKIIACYSVVILHCNGIIFWNFNYSSYKDSWISSLYIESIFYFAVPLFALSIGATLLDFNERYGLIIYYKRRILKIIIPLFCWNVILYIFRVYIVKNMRNEQLNFVNIWNIYFGSKVYQIFDSFHSFLICYMIIPLIAYIEKSHKIKIYSYCTLVLLIINTTIPYLIKLIDQQLIWNYKIDVNFIIYIFCGYIIQNHIFSFKAKLLIYFFGILGFLVHLFGTMILTLRDKQIRTLHKGYLNLPCILYSISSFLFIKDNYNLLYKIVSKITIKKIGCLTIGPFFMHLPLNDLLIVVFKINKNKLWFWFFWAILNCSICLGLTYLMKKIPIIKFIVP